MVVDGWRSTSLLWINNDTSSLSTSKSAHSLSRVIARCSLTCIFEDSTAILCDTACSFYRKLWEIGLGTKWFWKTHVTHTRTIIVISACFICYMSMSCWSCIRYDFIGIICGNLSTHGKVGQAQLPQWESLLRCSTTTPQAPVFLHGAYPNSPLQILVVSEICPNSRATNKAATKR